MECQNIPYMPERMPDRMSESMSDRMPEKTSEYVSDRISVGGDIFWEDEHSPAIQGSSATDSTDSDPICPMIWGCIHGGILVEGSVGNKQTDCD